MKRFFYFLVALFMALLLSGCKGGGGGSSSGGSSSSGSSSINFNSDPGNELLLEQAINQGTNEPLPLDIGDGDDTSGFDDGLSDQDGPFDSDGGDLNIPDANINPEPSTLLLLGTSLLGLFGYKLKRLRK